MDTICVITPTIGRKTLKRALMSARLTPDDEWLVIGDGPQPEAERVLRGLAVIPYLRYVEGPLTHNQGNEQRDLGMSLSDRDYFLFLDDDDVFLPGAIEIVKRHLGELSRPQPIIFRMHHDGRIRWESRILFPGNVRAPMLCVPNIPDKLGRWADVLPVARPMKFIEDTLSCYDEEDVIWSGDVIVRCDK